MKAPTEEAQALERLAAFVGDRVPAGEPVFVANPRHDLLRVGNPLAYVLLERPNPTRYDVMQPGVVTSAGVQREIVADLRRSRPELVVRWLSPVASEAEPNGAGRSSRRADPRPLPEAALHRDRALRGLRRARAGRDRRPCAMRW